MKTSSNVWWELNKKSGVLKIHDDFSGKSISISSVKERDNFLEDVRATNEDILVGDGFVPQFMENDVLDMFASNTNVVATASVSDSLDELVVGSSGGDVEGFDEVTDALLDAHIAPE